MNEKTKLSRRETKAHLRTLVENSSFSRVRNLSRVVKYGVASYIRNIWLSIAATLVMTITLVILMVTIFASTILGTTADAMRQKIDITIFFTPGTPVETLNVLSDKMRTEPNVTSIAVADSAAEYAAFRAENTDNPELMAALTDESMNSLMLSTMQATMRLKVRDPDDLSGIINLVDTDPGFQANLDKDKEPTYNVNRAEIATITSWARIAKNGGLILGAVFLIISILVIFNTIRMAIFSRHEEINMMKLVGADPSFIRGPFLVEAEISGIISGTLAATLALVGYNFIEPPLTSYGIDVSAVTAIMHSTQLIAIYFIMIIIGIIIGAISARLAIKKYLRQA